MDPIIEAISKLIPLGAWFEKIGWGKELGEAVSVVIITLLLGAFVCWVARLWKHAENMKAARNLMPQFDEASIRQAQRYYIPTQYQNASPTRQDEPGFTHQYIARNKLIPFFINIAFNSKNESERFYLILADSGMGKTTFMVNLYMQYYSFFNRKKTKEMRLFRFSHPDTLLEIKSITNDTAKKTILLLDALDEDPNIISKDVNMTDSQAFQIRLNEIIEATRNFCEVVITCRTQYFPGQENDPYELLVKRPDEKGYYTLNKLYISPFTIKEVKKYLNKKFGIRPLILNRKKLMAYFIVKKSNLLIMRPMLLSYIDYLIDSPKIYGDIYDIYDTLIEQWLIREGEKRKNLYDRDDFIKNLKKFSEQAALKIYGNKHTRMYLTKDEAISIGQLNNIELKPEEITGQSLLTYDGSGNWKFAHKSIFEFFIAKKAIEDFNFLKNSNFSNLDMSLRFFEEKNSALLKLVKGGKMLKNLTVDIIHYDFWICTSDPRIYIKPKNEVISEFKNAVFEEIRIGFIRRFMYKCFAYLEEKGVIDNEIVTLTLGLIRRTEGVVYKQVISETTKIFDDEQASRICTDLNSHYGFPNQATNSPPNTSFNGFQIASQKEMDYAGAILKNCEISNIVLYCKSNEALDFSE